jgi:hypothetical protein
MPSTIWDTLHHIDKYFAQPTSFDIDEFDALLETSGLGRAATAIGPKNIAKQRAIELKASDQYRKARLVVHHAKVCLEHFEYFKRDFADSEEYSPAARLKKYQELPEDRAMRLVPLFTPDMLETFPELEQYATRWDIWDESYRKHLLSVYAATSWMTQTERNKERCRLFRGVFLQSYEELVWLLSDLIALGE